MAYVLIIEDDVEFRHMLVQMLERDGHKVATAGDGAEALALLAGVRPDLVLTDILMPNMDGVEFIMEFSKLSRHTPVIAMSGGRRAITSEFNLESAAMLGVKATLVKPFSRADLRKTIEAAIGVNSANRAPAAH